MAKKKQDELLTEKVEEKDENFEDSLEYLFGRKLEDGDSNRVLSMIAQHICKLYKVVFYNGTLYIKFDKKYISNKKEIARFINCEVRLTKRQYNELLYQLPIYATKIDEPVDRIRLNNGILTYVKDKGYSVVEDDGSFCPYNIDVDYNPDIKEEKVMNFLKEVSCDNDDIYNMLIEIIGCVLITEPKAQFMFFIYGVKGRNGKSTFTSMLSEFIGKEHTSNISIVGFKDSTTLTTLAGKLLNVCDDADYEKIYLERSQMLKSLASGQQINCRAIYSMPIEFRNTATIIGTSNNIPEFADKSGGMRRRLIIIEFNMDVTKENNDPYLLEKLTTSEAKTTILNLAIDGMNRVANNNYFITENKTLTKTLDEYYKSSDTVKDFIDTKFKSLKTRKVSDVYDAYTTFCEEEICKEKESKNVFGMRMKQYGYISTVVTNSGEKSCRVYKEK